MSRITVVGAGFGALTAIRKLRAANTEVQIDVIAPKPEFVYFPGTIWIPTGLRRPEDVVIPLQNFFQRMNVRYHEAVVTGLSDGGRTLEEGVACKRDQSDAVTAQLFHEIAHPPFSLLQAVRFDILGEHALGGVEEENGRLDRAAKHWSILKKVYRAGILSKEDFATALRAHQAALMRREVPRGR